MRAWRIHVTGVVQGVGFRPHVWTLAHRLGLKGWVRNDSSGVAIVVEGDDPALACFLQDLRAEAPPRSRIDGLVREDTTFDGFDRFEIRGSRAEEGVSLPVSPDLATCADCLRELGDPSDRRHRYPFINCTNCGPRFTIVRDIPYDRPRTTMAAFPLCDDCVREYENPADRRFHAQPVACPACGPRLWLEEEGRRSGEAEEALQRARRLLAEGAIVAVKGLGGFHLAVDAASADAVARLRRRKIREEKPFALMTADVGVVARHAVVTDAARALLESVERPVVLLPRRRESSVAVEVAPGRDHLGFMLPYSPLHHLLMESGDGFPEALVMTSGNRSDEPIAYENDDARARLGDIADAMLLHDRPIHIRTDDSVVAELRGAPYFFRRSRGYAPLPVGLPFPATAMLAVGGELKNTFCVAREDRAFLGHHIGDLQYDENVDAFERGIAHFERLFRVRPESIVHDLHPDYQSTRYAEKRAQAEALPTVAVQHHHAHVAAGMAENGLDEDERVLGLSFDGTGYGPDGAIWGGEFLIAGYREYERALHLEYCPLPGGDAAIRAPWRTALSWLRQAGLEWSRDLPPVAAAGDEELAVLDRQLDLGLNSPLTSSLGRLFDAVASLSGIRHRTNYEAQAACELEAAAAAVPEAAGAYEFGVAAETVEVVPVIREVVKDVKSGVPAAIVAARFHHGLARLSVTACRRLRDASGIEKVVLSGGVWQNTTLLREAVAALERDGFEALVHRQVPANDGGLALGQVAVAAARARTPGTVGVPGAGSRSPRD